MPGTLKGILVGFANTLVVALYIANGIGDGDELEAYAVIVMFAFLPAALTGAVLGHLGEKLQTMNRTTLMIAMTAAACGVVAFLGVLLGISELVLVSCIPTVAACAILERWTRAKPDEVFPVARVA